MVFAVHIQRHRSIEVPIYIYMTYTIYDIYYIYHNSYIYLKELIGWGAQKFARSLITSGVQSVPCKSFIATSHAPPLAQRLIAELTTTLDSLTWLETVTWTASMRASVALEFSCETFHTLSKQHCIVNTAFPRVAVIQVCWCSDTIFAASHSFARSSSANACCQVLIALIAAPKWNTSKARKVGIFRESVCEKTGMLRCEKTQDQPLYFQ